MKPRVFNPIVFVSSSLLLAVSALGVFVYGSEIVRFYLWRDSFVVGQSRQVCEAPLNNRCVTHYSIYRTDSIKEDFVPFGGQFEGRRLSPGLRFKKTVHGFDYQIDGVVESWPFLQRKAMLLSLCLIGSLAWVAAGGLGILKSWAASFAPINSRDRLAG